MKRLNCSDIYELASFKKKKKEKKVRYDCIWHMIVRVPGWVTAVSLCCFCNVALIFATMKTFILQQVKCCHLSPFLFKLIYSLDPFHWFTFLFSRREVSSASFITCFSFRRSPHLSCGPSFSDSLYFSEWRSLVGLLFFGGVDLRGLTVHICPYLLISAMGSQLLMKSPSVLRTVTWSWVKGFWPLVAAFLWRLLTFSSLGSKGLGRRGCPFFYSWVFGFSDLKLYDLCSHLL